MPPGEGKMGLCRELEQQTYKGLESGKVFMFKGGIGSLLHADVSDEVERKYKQRGTL